MFLVYARLCAVELLELGECVYRHVSGPVHCNIFKNCSVHMVLYPLKMTLFPTLVQNAGIRYENLC